MNVVYASSAELDSDRVAAREISARIESLCSEIDDLLREAFLVRAMVLARQEDRADTEGKDFLASPHP